MKKPKSGSKINWFRLKVFRHLAILKRITVKRLFNIIQLVYELNVRRIKVKSHPFIAHINTVPFCNIRCPGCYLQTNKNDSNATKKIMVFDEYREVIDKLSPYLMLVVLYDEGEPLLNKDIFKMIRYNHHLNINTSIATNLSMELSDIQIDNLVSCGLDRLQVAMDGITADIYEQYRIGGNLDRVKNNLQRILESKKRQHSKYPSITIQYIDFGFNSHQMQAVKAYSQEIGAAFSTLRSSENGLYDFIQKENMRISEPGHLAIGCFDLYGIAQIRSDSVLFPCDFGEDEGMHLVGSLQDNDFQTLWNSEFMQELRNGFKRNSHSLPAVQCRDCQATNRIPVLFH
jgi:sulfatase maturation enzyme AslB (radical SAM superfamily)